MASILSSSEESATAGETNALLSHLRFTARQENGKIDFWRPEAIAGDWNDHCAAGREYAEDLADYLAASGNASALPAIARRIAERSSFGGIETGFFTSLAARLG